MNFKKLLLLGSLLILVFSAVSAQTSSKSKSKSKLYEKGKENKNVKVKNEKSLNSPNTDYSPAYFKNGLVYVSSRENARPTDKKTGESYFELYHSPFDPLGEPTAPSPFSVEINSSAHEGPVTFSADFKTIFFTRNNMKNGVKVADRDGVVRLKIYEARQGNFDWMDLREMPFNSDNYSCMHPTLSVDGNSLYFSSDMPGGVGGFDLYVCKKEKTGWSLPNNLGKEVNTEKNEVFPFIHAGGTLFYSSNGHNSLGGLDIFFANPVEGGNYEVVNMGEPFNSEKDDLGIVMNEESSKGFFSSDRANGFGKDDIYSFSVEQGIQGVEKPETRRLKIKVSDGQASTPIRQAAIRVFTIGNGGFIGKGNELYEMDFKENEQTPNVFSLTMVRKEADDLGNADLYSNVAGEANYDFTQHKTYLILATFEGYEPAEKMVTFDGNEPEVIDFQMFAAAPCIAARGIVLTSQSADRIADAKIVYRQKSSGRLFTVRSNSNGEYDICLPAEGSYYVQVQKAGFSSDQFSVDITNSGDNKSEPRLIPQSGDAEISDLANRQFEVGNTFVIDQIKYDYNKATLNESGVFHLESLAKLLTENPKMEIDLIAHTDALGDAGENQRLSETRAEYAKRYLKSRKIDPKRIRALGKGETTPINKCSEGSNCSEEERLKNRRFEVYVRKI